MDYLQNKLFLKNLEEFDNRLGLLLKLVEEEKITPEDCFDRVESLFEEFKESFKGLK
tara:strand:+ start:700 stop:870 length:171 start_codon:yes stop_codon:yes gene_type:complete